MGKRQTKKTIEAIFRHPPSGNLREVDVTKALEEIGADVSWRGKVLVVKYGADGLFTTHRSHKRGPNLDKGAIAGIREMLREQGFDPNDLD